MYTMKVWALEFTLAEINFFFVSLSKKKYCASLQFYFDFLFRPLGSEPICTCSLKAIKINLTSKIS